MDIYILFLHIFLYSLLYFNNFEELTISNLLPKANNVKLSKILCQYRKNTVTSKSGSTAPIMYFTILSDDVSLLFFLNRFYLDRIRESLAGRACGGDKVGNCRLVCILDILFVKMQHS